nr:MAG TPA: hypothetical protein [Caudoviricetes sp.]
MDFCSVKSLLFLCSSVVFASIRATSSSRSLYSSSFLGSTPFNS